MSNALRPGFGLPGGKVGVINGISVTVKCLIFSENGILIVKEKNPQIKSQEERVKTALSFKELRHRLWKVIARKRKAGDRSIDPEVFKKIIEETENRGDESIILMSAVREILEETGLLISPKKITGFDVKSSNSFPHQVVICLGEPVSGKLKKESLETFNNFFSLSLLPPTDGEAVAEKICKSQLMYYRHKVFFLPSSLEILLKENYHFPFPKEGVENFLKNKIPAS